MNASPSQDNPKRSRPSGTEITILVIIVGLTLGIAFLGWQIASNTAKDMAYRRALPCGSGVGATLGNCISYQTMQVTNKDTTEYENLPDTHSLDLQDAKASLTQVEINEQLYSVVSVGTYVNVKFWRGKPMTVMADGIRSGTSNHPEVANRQHWTLIIIFCLCEWVSIRLYYDEKRKKTRRSEPDAPWIAKDRKSAHFQTWQVKEDENELTMTQPSSLVPIACLCVFLSLLTFGGIIDYLLYPVGYSAVLVSVALAAGFFLFCFAMLWFSNHEASKQAAAEKILRFSQGGTSVTRNEESLGVAKKIFLEERIRGEEKGDYHLKVAVEIGDALYLGSGSPDNMKSIRPFATHLAAFLDLPLEFTKEEKPGSD